ncbi:DUF883 family protein [Actibacterium lipolyticum]|uniref:DUF883 domain-containing protein n=1 Tax=Actibacterium lipolyticum TaxID=1524263 RepID=A0A238KJD4_9RHOB|nr:DUF883 family protein [Actibacterium lipolyticum]SMX42935.1 hypothetical protein COL8621_02140 [Actibacterium lipolyticum]
MARTQTNGSAAQTSAELEEQIATLRSDVAAIAGTLSDYGKAQKTQLADAAAETLNGAKAFGDEKAQQAKQQARDAYAEASKAVRANPAASIGIAAGIGFAVGLLTARR